MAINPNITSYQPKAVEGEVRQFGPNDIRKLARTPSGVVRWMSEDSQNEESDNSPAPSTNGNLEPFTPGKAAQTDIQVSPQQRKTLDSFVKDNPFLSCVTLEDIDEMWYEEISKIKSDKLWYQNEIDKLEIKFKLSYDNKVKKGIREGIDRFRKVVESQDRENKINLQRVAYEFYRLTYIIQLIKDSNPAFDYKQFIASGKTMDDLEKLIEKEPENV